jgi:CRISPR-associated protein Cas5t
MMEARTTMIWIAIEAPFAACRPMMAGWHRPTAGFLTHSAVYGLILNVAGVESRLGEHDAGHPGGVPASVTRNGLPSFRLALGLPDGAELPRVGTVFQQLHNYSVAAGNAGIKPEFALGRKNNIAPVRRELLSNIRAVAVIQADDDFAEVIRRGLRGECNDRRYGLPFLGDNNFTLDRLDSIDSGRARWFALADAGRGEPPCVGTTRLTTYIDRLTPVGTRSALFAPTEDFSAMPPESALVPVGDPLAFDHWAARQRFG